MKRVVISDSKITALEIKSILESSGFDSVTIHIDCDNDSEAKRILSDINSIHLAQCSLGIRRSAIIEPNDDFWMLTNKKSKGDKKRAARDRRKYGVY